MKSTVEKLGPTRVSLQVEVDENQVEAALQQAYKKVVKDVSVPGFRKGRVPRKILEARFGPEILYEDAMDILLPRAYSEALAENDLDPIAQPKVDLVQFEQGKPFIFKAEVEVMPEVDLGEYKGLAVTKKLEKVTDDQVEDVLKQYQERMAELVTVDRSEVQEGDFITVDFEGFIDGEPFPGGAAKNQSIEIGSGTFIPGFEEGLVGAKAGETTEVEVTFPDEYPEELAGKDAVFKVTVHEIKEKRTPELDDEFAKEVGDFETLDDLRSDIEERLTQAAEEQATSRAKDELVEQVVEASSVEVPKTLVDRAVDQLINDLRRDLSYRNMTLEQYLEAMEKTEEELREESRPDAEKRVKTRMVLDAIADNEGIQVEEEEIDKEIQLIARQGGQDPEQFAKRLNTPQVRESISDRLRVTKAVDFILENAEVTEEIVESADEEEANEAQEE